MADNFHGWHENFSLRKLMTTILRTRTSTNGSRWAWPTTSDGERIDSSLVIRHYNLKYTCKCDTVARKVNRKPLHGDDEARRWNAGYTPALELIYRRGCGTPQLQRDSAPTRRYVHTFTQTIHPNVVPFDLKKSLTKTLYAFGARNFWGGFLRRWCIHTTQTSFSSSPFISYPIL